MRDALGSLQDDIRRWLGENPLRSLRLLADLVDVPALMLSAFLRGAAAPDPRLAAHLRRALAPLLGER